MGSKIDLTQVPDICSLDEHRKAKASPIYLCWADGPYDGRQGVLSLDIAAN